jgi:PsbP-like protein
LSSFSSSSISNKSVDIPTISASKIKFSTYDNSSIGVKFLYPSGWKPVIRETLSNSTVIEILFPNITTSSSSGNFSGGHWHGPATSFITMSIVNVSSSASSRSNTTEAALNSLTKQNLVLANRTLPNFELISSNESTFAGNPAHKIVYTFTEPSLVTPSDFQFQSMNVWTIKGDKQYTLSYSQPIEEYPTYLGVVQQIIDSFKIV